MQIILCSAYAVVSFADTSSIEEPCAVAMTKRGAGVDVNAARLGISIKELATLY